MSGKSFFVRVKNSLHSCMEYFFCMLPLNNYCVVMESEGDFTDSARAFYDYMIDQQHNEKYKIVWFVREPDKYKPEKNVEFVSRCHHFFNIRASYYLSTSRFFVITHGGWLRKRRDEQVVIHTCHSVAQLKAGGSLVGWEKSDYVLCCSEYCADVKRKVQNASGSELLRIGMSRIDLMYRHVDCIDRLIADYSGQKIILSMSTFKQAREWKDSGLEDPYAINVVTTKADIQDLNDFLKNHGAYMIVKIHHLQDLTFIREVHLDHIKYLTDDDLMNADIQVNQLLENASVLLTDYSSVFYDFLIKDRPIGFVLADMDSYSRGFLMEEPLAEMPGEKIYTLGQLKHFIESTLSGKDEYSKERKKIKEKVFQYDDGENCKRLYDFIESVQNE